MVRIFQGHSVVFAGVCCRFRSLHWPFVLGVVWGHVCGRTQMAGKAVPAARLSVRGLSPTQMAHQHLGQLVDSVILRIFFARPELRPRVTSAVAGNRRYYDVSIILRGNGLTNKTSIWTAGRIS